VYLLHKHLNQLHKEFTEDCLNKAKIIERVIPQIIFGDNKDMEDEFNLALDLWSHFSRVEVSNK